MSIQQPPERQVASKRQRLGLLAQRFKVWSLVFLVLLRHIGGWSLIVLGLLGLILPVLPGIVLLVLGIIVLGPRDPTLRRIAFSIRLTLRRCSRARRPFLRQLGWKLRHAYNTTRLQFRSQLKWYQHRKSSLQAYLLLLAFASIMLVTVAGMSIMLWGRAP